jgi:hypothetical protein
MPILQVVKVGQLAPKKYRGKAREHRQRGDIISLLSKFKKRTQANNNFF